MIVMISNVRFWKNDFYGIVSFHGLLALQTTGCPIVPMSWCWGGDVGEVNRTVWTVIASADAELRCSSIEEESQAGTKQHLVTNQEVEEYIWFAPAWKFVLARTARKPYGCSRICGMNYIWVMLTTWSTTYSQSENKYQFYRDHAFGHSIIVYKWQCQWNEMFRTKTRLEGCGCMWCSRSQFVLRFWHPIIEHEYASGLWLYIIASQGTIAWELSPLSGHANHQESFEAWAERSSAAVPPNAHHILPD